MTVHCPTCGSKMLAAHAPLESLTSAPMSHRERQIVDALARAYPRPLTTSQIVNDIYSDDWDGGPETANNVVSVLLTRIRPKIRQFGWEVPRCLGGKGKTAEYRLKPLEAGG